MKLNKFTNVLVFGLVLTVAVAGCRKRPGYLTPLPGVAMTSPKDDESANALGNKNKLAGEDIATTPMTDPSVREKWPRDAKVFEAYTVHFDYDRSVVNAGEKHKVASVADYLKANPTNALEIDGHADERGTEEYNRALGERRALALREELARMGIDPTRIDTVSFGKDRPVDPGHSEAAHKKNRRGEFLLETPPK